MDKLPEILRIQNSRRGYKSCITVALNKLHRQDLDLILFKKQEDLINKWITKIDDLNNEIITKCALENIEVNLDEENEYLISINEELSNIENGIQIVGLNNSNNTSTVEDNNFKSLVGAIAGLQNNAITPKLTCNKFSGKTNNKFEYKNFMVQFTNCTANMTMNSAKLAYLRSCLSDFALQIISHLTVTEDNYDVAINLLNDEFLDEEFIIDEIFKQILN